MKHLSSRSHAFLIIILTKKFGLEGIKIKRKINLIDLAGNEKPAGTGMQVKKEKEKIREKVERYNKLLIYIL